MSGRSTVKRRFVGGAFAAGVVFAAGLVIATGYRASSRTLSGPGKDAPEKDAPVFSAAGFALASLTPRVMAEVMRGPADRTAEEAALRKDGFPVTAAEMRKLIGTVPADQNAAALYTRLGEILKKNPDMTLPKAMKPTTPLPRIDEDVNEKLSQRADVMETIERAASKPRCQFPVKWEDAREDAPLPWLLTMRRAAHLVVLKSERLARQGRYAAAVREQAMGFTLAQQAAASTPTIIGYLNGRSSDWQSLNGMRKILQIAGPNAAVDDQVYQAIRQHRRPLDRDRAYWSEALMAIQITDQVKKNPSMLSSLTDSGTQNPPLKMETPQERALFGKIMDANLTKVVHWYRMVYRVARQPTYPERIALAQKLGVDDETTERQLESPDATTILPQIFLMYGPMWELDAEEDARAQVTIAGALVLAYRAEHGHYPARLKDAARGAFNPFSMKPLRYRQQNGGFVVFSGGQDGKFDGNPIPPGTRSHNRPAALSFRYPEPAASAEKSGAVSQTRAAS